jgi:hypothetical protein
MLDRKKWRRYHNLLVRKYPNVVTNKRIPFAPQASPTHGSTHTLGSATAATAAQRCRCRHRATRTLHGSSLHRPTAQGLELHAAVPGPDDRAVRPCRACEKQALMPSLTHARSYCKEQVVIGGNRCCYCCSNQYPSYDLLRRSSWWRRLRCRVPPPGPRRVREPGYLICATIAYQLSKTVSEFPDKSAQLISSYSF